MVASILDSPGTSLICELPLHSRTNSEDSPTPEFTVSSEGDAFYPEHLGMRIIPGYGEQCEPKREWQKANGFTDRLIVSAHGQGVSVDADEIERIAQTRSFEVEGHPRILMK